jgi:hypothetical protein
MPIIVRMDEVTVKICLIVSYRTDINDKFEKVIEAY